MAIITVAQAEKHLRLDLENDGGSPVQYTDERLPDLELKIMQAEAIVLDYLKVDGDPLEASPAVWTDRDISVVQAATLLVLSALYDDAPDRTLGDYMAPGGVIALLLARLRDPTVA